MSLDSNSRPFTFAALWMFSALLGGCAAPAAKAPHDADSAELTPPPDGVTLLSRYPHSPALALTRDTYVDAAAGRGRDSVFMTTWFPGPDARVGEWCSIDPRGRIAIYRFVHDVGFQESRSTSLVESQVPELQSLLQTLPASAPPKSLDHVLVVGFRRAPGVWETRVYDRTSPPAVVRRIFREMTGAPLDAADPR